MDAKPNGEMTLKEWDEQGGILFITEYYTILRHWVCSIEQPRYFMFLQLSGYPYFVMADGLYAPWAFGSLQHVMEHHQHREVAPRLEDRGQAIFS